MRDPVLQDKLSVLLVCYGGTSVIRVQRLDDRHIVIDWQRKTRRVSWRVKSSLAN